MEAGDEMDVREREKGEISTSSITNSCPSIGCRYIQTLPRKGQSLCRPLCRPRAFLLLSVSSASAAAAACSSVSFTHLLLYVLSSLLLTSPFPPSQSRFSSEERGGSHSCVDGRCGQDAATKEKGSKPRVTREREKGKRRIRLALGRERRTAGR